MESKNTESTYYFQKIKRLQPTLTKGNAIANEEAKLDSEVEEEWKQLHEPKAGRIEVSMNQRAQQICKGLRMYEAFPTTFYIDLYFFDCKKFYEYAM